MNAFDLINKSGTLDLTRLVRDQKNYHGNRCTRFTTRAPIEEVQNHIRESLDNMPYIGYSVDKRSHTFHVTARSAMKGLVLLDIVFSKITETTYLVSFERKRGSILDFWKIYNAISQQSSHLASDLSPTV